MKDLQVDEKNPIPWIQVSREKEPKNQGLDTSQLDF